MSSSASPHARRRCCTRLAHHPPPSRPGRSLPYTSSPRSSPTPSISGLRVPAAPRSPPPPYAPRPVARVSRLVRLLPHISHLANGLFAVPASLFYAAATMKRTHMPPTPPSLSPPSTSHTTMAIAMHPATQTPPPSPPASRPPPKRPASASPPSDRGYSPSSRWNRDTQDYSSWPWSPPHEATSPPTTPPAGPAPPTQDVPSATPAALPPPHSDGTPLDTPTAAAGPSVSHAASAAATPTGVPPPAPTAIHTLSATVTVAITAPEPQPTLGSLTAATLQHPAGAFFCHGKLWFPAGDSPPSPRPAETAGGPSLPYHMRPRPPARSPAERPRQWHSAETYMGDLPLTGPHAPLPTQATLAGHIWPASCLSAYRSTPHHPASVPPLLPQPQPRRSVTRRRPLHTLAAPPSPTTERHRPQHDKHLPTLQHSRCQRSLLLPHPSPISPRLSACEWAPPPPRRRRHAAICLEPPRRLRHTCTPRRSSKPECTRQPTPPPTPITPPRHIAVCPPSRPALLRSFSSPSPPRPRAARRLRRYAARRQSILRPRTHPQRPCAARRLHQHAARRPSVPQPPTRPLRPRAAHRHRLRRHAACRPPISRART